jgi:hypothetical protein
MSILKKNVRAAIDDTLHLQRCLAVSGMHECGDR